MTGTAKGGRSELARQDVGYKALSGRLVQLGIEESPRQLANKINRGTFSFVFFLKCMKALGARTVELPLAHKRTRMGVFGGRL